MAWGTYKRHYFKKFPSQSETDCMDKSIRKNNEGLNNIFFKVGLMPICKYFPENRHKGRCLMHKKDHTIGHKSRLHKSKNVELVQKASPDHNIVNSVINTK